MRRRDLLKTIGILGITGVSAITFSSCNPKEAQKEAEKKLSERDKLIVNRKKMAFQDPENPTDFELKHTPDIVIGEKNEQGFTRVDILVGSKGIIHPTKPDHWIDYLTLFADNKKILHVEYEAGVAMGFASFYVKADGVKNIKAEIGCNLHGIWENSVDLQQTA